MEGERQGELPDGGDKWTWKNDDKAQRDRLLQDYDSIVRESALLTTFAGFLFGFLLTISVSPPEAFSFINDITLLVAITSITVAISLFILPVVYHHLQFPYDDLEKFKQRAHRFLVFGFVPTAVTLYLSLELAMSFVAGDLAFALAIIPFALVYFLFLKRK